MVKLISKSMIWLAAAMMIFLSSACQSGKEEQSSFGDIKVSYSGDAKVEVGGPYVGIELHHSSPLLQRISFYYPVANSLDESTDYWKRDTSFIMQLGLKIGDNKKEFIGKEPFRFDLTPYSVNYYKSDKDKSISISYRFTKTKPAMIVRYEIKNESNQERSFEFYTHLETAIRTSHSFNLIDKAWTEYDSSNGTIYTNFDDPQTQSAQVFVSNSGEKPRSYSTSSGLTGLMNPGNEWLTQNISDLPDDLLTRDSQGRPAAKFIYKKSLQPQQSMVIIQIIGSCRQEEGKEIVSYLNKHYDDEVNAYEHSIMDKIGKEQIITSNDTIIDHSVLWARAILEANTHYLDGDYVPMPCPAEYNFYFTHDVLKTDLAAVNFDTARVKRDLTFIMKHANKDHIIPHAYYWKDSSFATELAAHDNWNNFWLIIVSGSYLRHSADIAFLRTLYPYIQKSLDQALLTKGGDDLMWSNMPDWWDIGEKYGPRAYMTILAIKAIREYLYISTVLGENMDRFSSYEQLAARMQNQLNEKLWDGKLNYLINYYEPGRVDEHYYTGSLLAAHYGLIDKTRITGLVNTAQTKLLDPKVGVYNVFPMDFNTLKNYLKFSGNEAGDPFLYANGGIWPHGNAWYALALMAEDKKAEAFTFIRNIMTVEGVMAGPNGQPAMYEVRNGNFNDPAVYGTVDKPQFLWAAGWYLYSLYHLYAIQENEWNISLDPYNTDAESPVQLDVFSGGKLSKVSVIGNGKYIKKILYDGVRTPTAVIPVNGRYGKIELYTGVPEIPYLKSCKSMLNNGQYDENTRLLTLDLKSFPGHADEIEIISPAELTGVLIDDKPLSEKISTETKDGVKVIKFGFTHSSSETKIKLKFI